MKNAKIIYFPAIIAVVFSLLLVAYSLYAQPHGAKPPHPPEGMQRPDFRPEESSEPFKMLGTVAVIIGAVSFSWLLFRKKLTSPSPIVRQAGKLLYNIHTYAGWTALILIAVHGAYFLVTKLQDRNIYTGLAGLAIILALAGYGWAIKRVKHKNLRFVHRLLSFVWLPILMLHAGGSFIATALVTLALWGAVRVVERAAVSKTIEGN